MKSRDKSGLDSQQN